MGLMVILGVVLVLMETIMVFTGDVLGSIGGMLSSRLEPIEHQ